MAPGFGDAHTHFIDGGIQLASVDLRSADTPQEFTRRIKAYAGTLAPGEWVTQGMWDHEAWGGSLPDRSWIDSVTPDNPVFVSRLDGHMGLANSAALKLAGLDRHARPIPGGTIVRRPDGELSGVLKDEAMGPIFRVLPDPSPAQADSAVSRATHRGDCARIPRASRTRTSAKGRRACSARECWRTWSSSIGTSPPMRLVASTRHGWWPRCWAERWSIPSRNRCIRKDLDILFRRPRTRAIFPGPRPPSARVCPGKDHDGHSHQSLEGARVHQAREGGSRRVLPGHVPLPAHRRPRDPAQAPEPDLLPDLGRRPRGRARGGGEGAAPGLRLVLHLLSRPRALPAASA